MSHLKCGSTIASTYLDNVIHEVLEGTVLHAFTLLSKLRNIPPYSPTNKHGDPSSGNRENQQTQLH